MDAVEAYKPYIEQYRLNDVYSTVFHAKIEEFDQLAGYDLIIMGDVLEHLSVAAAQHVLTNAADKEYPKLTARIRRHM